MSAKTSIYLDTTIPSAYFDRRAEERLAFTVRFWNENLPHYNAHISDITLDEINQTVDPKLRRDLLALVSGFTVLKTGEPMHALAATYIKKGIFPNKYYIDALHVALATCTGLSILVSWNYEHMVKVKTRHLVERINTANGHKTLEIVSPREL